MTPSFICEIELNPDERQAKVLNVRLDCARQVYNAVLGESLRRLERMKATETYKVAAKMPKTIKDKKNAKRNKLFKDARDEVGFSEYALHAYAKQFNHCWLGDHLDINTIQKVASRAYRAVNEYAIGKRGKPRFKGVNRLKSVEGKSNKSGIRFKNNAIVWLGETFDLLIPDDDAVIAHSLNSRIKYVRLVKKVIRGKMRWYAQLVCEGLAYRKPKNVVSPGIVGLDIGPSTLAYVSPDHADLIRFCDELDDKSAEIARLQRQIERQRRANNPGNYEPDRWVLNPNGKWIRKLGKIKPGRHQWHISRRMRANMEHKAELERQVAAHRKSLHGQLVNQILALGTTIQTEKISYKAFQRLFGKSIGKRAPGMFMEMLRRKAANAGGAVIEFSTFSTRLSQTCHGCGTIQKKPLSERWHDCDCGIVAQRDLYSAFLATCVESDRLVAQLANDGWSWADCLIRAAASRTQSVIGQAMPKVLAPSSAIQSQNGSSVHISKPLDKAAWSEQLPFFSCGESSLA